MAEIEKLDPQFKTDWVAALRSGKYDQGVDALVKINGVDKDVYCCLGVACIVAGMSIEEIKGKAQIEKQMTEYYPILKPLATVIGEKENISNGIVINLMRMNDGYKAGNFRRHTFLEIADYIEENL